MWLVTLIAGVLVVLALLQLDRQGKAKFAERQRREQERMELRALKAEARTAAAAQKTAALAERARLAAAPPPPVYGRWTIIYQGRGDGDDLVETTRTVRVLEVKPRLMQLICWCELRQARRTFSIMYIRQAADAETGEIIALGQWLEDYQRQRRNRPSR